MRYEPKGFSQCRPDGNGGWLTTTFDLSKLTRGGDISVGDYFVEFIVERLIPALSIILF
jgi:hypothetical protein